MVTVAPEIAKPWLSVTAPRSVPPVVCAAASPANPSAQSAHTRMLIVNLFMFRLPNPIQAIVTVGFSVKVIRRYGKCRFAKRNPHTNCKEKVISYDNENE
jgi:hypothetical protein